MNLSDLMNYAQLGLRVLNMIRAAVDNADGQENEVEAFVRRANELAGTIVDNAAAGLAFDSALAGRVNALADEYEANGARKTPEEWRNFADDVADTAQRLRTKLKVRIAEQAA